MKTTLAPMPVDRPHLAPTSELRVPARGAEVSDDLLEFGLGPRPTPVQQRLLDYVRSAAALRRPLPFDRLTGSDRVHATGLIQRGLATITKHGDIRPAGE